MEGKGVNMGDAKYKSTDVYINHTVWEILFVPETHEVLKCKDKDTEYFGMCRYKTSKIYIGIMDIQAMRDTLMHELTHAIFFCYFGTNGQVLNEEEVCNFTACYGDMIVSMTNRVMETYKDLCEASLCQCDNCTCGKEVK